MLEKITAIEINGQNVDEMQEYVKQYSSLIEKRVKKFAEKGIHQWQDNYAERNNAENVTKTLKENPDTKSLVMFVDIKNEVVLGGTMLKTQERPGYWDNGEYDTNVNARYITGLVTNADLPGTGKFLIKAIGEFAEKSGIEKLRLDCSYEQAENSFLAKVYSNCGFKKVGEGYKEAFGIYSDYTYALFEATPSQLIETLADETISYSKSSNQKL